MVTIQSAKKIIMNELKTMGLENKIKGKLVSFMDLARDSRIIITIFEWKPDLRAVEIEKVARINGFSVQFETKF